MSASRPAKVVQVSSILGRRKTEPGSEYPLRSRQWTSFLPAVRCPVPRIRHSAGRRLCAISRPQTAHGDVPEADVRRGADKGG